MENIKKYKSFFVWLVIWISFLSLWTFAATTWAWTIWSLFNLIWTEYRLAWDNIEDNTVDSSEIQDNTLTAADLAADSVGASELANDSVASANVIVNSLTAADLAVNSVWNEELIDNPQVAWLHVLGTGYPTVLIESTNTEGGDLMLQSSAWTYEMYMQWADLRFYEGAPANADRVTIKPGGNVWIWTTSPGEKLDVNGVIKSNNGGFALTWESSSHLSTDWSLYRYSWQAYLGFDDNLYFRDYNDSANRMIINSSWRVWIWTTSPAQQLHTTWVARFDGGVQVDGFNVINSVGSVVTSKYNGTTHYGYFEGRNSDWTRWFYLGRGNGSDYINLALDGASKLYIWGTTYATSFIYSSDERLKKNIFTLEDSLEKINKLRWVSFDWREDDVKDIGLIAQEIEEVYPDLVKTSDEGMKSVQYGNIVAILIEWVKELYTKVVWNTERITELETELEELKNEMNDIKKLLENK